MKRLLRSVAGVAVVLAVGGTSVVALALRTLPGAGATAASASVGVVYDATSMAESGYVRAAYDSVLTEEGVSFRWVPAVELQRSSAEQILERYQALVFPDAVARRLPLELRGAVGTYVRAGGGAAVIFDAGVADARGAYRPSGLFSSLLGVEYVHYDSLGERMYRTDRVRFTNERDARMWQMPLGKTIGRVVIGGYAYGGLNYPIAAAHRTAGDARVYAEGSDRAPVVALRPVGRGHALWVGLPLGYLKAYSDDMPLRVLLRTFLFDIVRIPHLVASPRGVGGVVVNWHVDSSSERRGIPALLRYGLVRPSLRYEFSVTAGPDRDELGDGLGFDACGRNRTLLRMLVPYGDIGSHGGWSHNWFALQLSGGVLTEAEVEALIARNDECVRKVTGRPIGGYAAPEGVHPQPLVTRILERDGVRAYYYVGDTGAPPNRSFFDGEMVSSRVWAFPVMPNGRHASIGEMRRAGISPERVGDWLSATLDYVVRNRTIRLVYSHPYDLLHAPYARAFGRFLDRAEALQRRGLLTVEPMNHFVDFLDRLVRTRASFVREGDTLVVTVRGSASLRDIAVAIPAEWELRDAPAWIDAARAGGYVIYTLETTGTDATFRLHRA